LEPVSLVARQPVLLVVNAKLGVQSLPELLDLARRRPGKLSYGTPGTGTELHLIGEHFKLATNTDIIHIPYKGGGPAISDLVGGTIDMMVVVSSSIIPHLRSGAVRALATTELKRVPALPDVPTLAELGYKDVDSTASWGVFMPSGSPVSAKDRWRQAVAAVARDSEFLARMAEMGVVCQPVGGADFNALLQREKLVWNKVITSARIRVE
jgi:tripartite-type tricarboxylate transporter receptor subunit TctC